MAETDLTSLDTGEFIDSSVPTVAPPVISFPTGSAVPTITADDNGVPVIHIPLTKKTKAHVGTAVAGVTVAGEFALQIIDPSNTTEALIIKAILGVAGLAGTWLGIALPTNLAKTVK